MNSYQELVSNLNKLYYDKTTSLPPNIVVYENTWNINWNNQLAIQRVYELSKMLNKSPDVIGKRVGQSAIWYNPSSTTGNGQYHRIEVLDQGYQHLHPTRHSDFMLVWFRMELKPEKAENISKINPSIIYYQPGQLIGVNCNFLAAGIGAISVIKEYNDCKISLEEAKDLSDIRLSDLADEFLESEQSVDIRNYPTSLKDILESYIMTSMIPDSVYEPIKETVISIDIVPSSTPEFLPSDTKTNETVEEDGGDAEEPLKLIDTSEKESYKPTNISISEIVKQLTKSPVSNITNVTQDKNTDSIDQLVKSVGELSNETSTDLESLERSQTLTLPPIPEDINSNINNTLLTKLPESPIATRVSTQTKLSTRPKVTTANKSLQDISIYRSSTNTSNNL
jgi:hypothetical protein